MPDQMSRGGWGGKAARTLGERTAGETMQSKWMNTLMNAYNRRAEVVGTLADTMGRQKLGSSPRQPSRRVKGEKESEWQAERREKQRENMASWPTNLHYLQGRSATLPRWLFRPPVREAGAGAQGGLNWLRLAAKLSGRVKWVQKRSSYLRGRIFARALGNTLLAMKRWNERPLLLALEIPSRFLWILLRVFHRVCAILHFVVKPLCSRRAVGLSVP